MKYLNSRHLQIGDRVGFSDSNVPASGVVIEDLGPDYVKVQWLDCRLATTHRRHALGFQRATGLREWMALIFSTAPQAVGQSR